MHGQKADFDLRNLKDKKQMHGDTGPCQPLKPSEASPVTETALESTPAVAASEAGSEAAAVMPLKSQRKAGDSNRHPTGVRGVSCPAFATHFFPEEELQAQAQGSSSNTVPSLVKDGDCSGGSSEGGGGGNLPDLRQHLLEQQWQNGQLERLDGLRTQLRQVVVVEQMGAQKERTQKVQQEINMQASSVQQVNLQQMSVQQASVQQASVQLVKAEGEGAVLTRLQQVATASMEGKGGVLARLQQIQLALNAGNITASQHEKVKQACIQRLKQYCVQRVSKEEPTPQNESNNQQLRLTSTSSADDFEEMSFTFCDAGPLGITALKGTLNMMTGVKGQAEKLGIKEYDVITACNGHSVPWGVSSELMQERMKMMAQRPAVLTIARSTHKKVEQQSKPQSILASQLVDRARIQVGQSAQHGSNQMPAGGQSGQHGSNQMPAGGQSAQHGSNQMPAGGQSAQHADRRAREDDQAAYLRAVEPGKDHRRLEVQQPTEMEQFLSRLENLARNMVERKQRQGGKVVDAEVTKKEVQEQMQGE
jgi:hypothetical protein